MSEIRRRFIMTQDEIMSDAVELTSNKVGDLIKGLYIPCTPLYFAKNYSDLLIARFRFDYHQIFESGSSNTLNFMNGVSSDGTTYNKKTIFY